MIAAGSRVRIKPGSSDSISSRSIGMVAAVADGECTVDFPEFSGWRGPVAQLELVQPSCPMCRTCFQCKKQSRVRFSIKLWVLLASAVFLTPVSVVFDTFANLYATNRFYGGDETAGTLLFSYCVATIGVCLVFIPLFVYAPFVKCVGFNGSIAVGILTISTGLFANGLATKPWMFLASTAVWAIGFQLLGPVSALLIARLAPKEALGRAMGLRQFFGNLSMVAGPTLLTPVYNFDSQLLFFILSASMLIVGAVLLWISLQLPARGSPTASGDTAEVHQAQQGDREDDLVPSLPPQLARQLSNTSTVNSLRQFGGLPLKSSLCLSRNSRDPLLRIYSDPMGSGTIAEASTPPMAEWTRTRTLSAPVTLPCPS